MIEDWGYRGERTTLPPASVPARIIATHGDYYRVICDQGECLVRTKSSAFRAELGAVLPTTGDFVVLKWNPSDEGRILSLLPRSSSFERPAPASNGRRMQTVAVNFDSLFFLMSANLDFSVRRMERFLSLVRSSGAETAVLVTKCDLVDESEERRLVAEASAAAPGVPVLAVSSRTGRGMGALARYVQPRRTLAFTGSSGVGKSSLVNALAGDDVMPTFDIRECDSRGRHTTTERELVMLPCGAMVIDTPGMREFGVIDAGEGMKDAFSDVERYFAGCRFSDCRHDTEPGCAVKAALAAGELSPERWLAYCRLRDERARVETTRVKSSHRYRK